MWVTPYGLGVRSYAGTALVTPSIVSVQVLNSNTAADWTTQTFNFNSPTGNIVVLFAARSNASNPTGFSATWAGGALDEEEDVEINAVNAGLGWAGWIRGGVTGSNDLVVTGGDGLQRDLLGYAISFDRLAASPIGAKTGASVNTSQSSYGLTLNVQNAMSRLVGLVASMHSNQYPLALNAGWSPVSPSARTGNGGIADIAAVCGQKAADATGNTTMTGTTTAAGPPVASNWCAVGLEVLPA